MTKPKFIPALGFKALTKLYDKVIAITMPESAFRTALIDSAFSCKQDAKVLEFGIGTASNSVLALKEYPGLCITGLDVDPEILELASEKTNAANVSVELKCYSGGTLPFESDCFDIVISSLVFHHLPPKDKQEAFNELFRVLKPSGKMVVVDWGRPRQTAGIVTFSLLRFFDGWKNTADHFDGNYLTMIEAAGFQKPNVIKSFNTIYGTLELVNTHKQ